jgi:protoporphyrinogen oxidase
MKDIMSLFGKEKFAVVGGGISGLIQAKEAMDKGYEVTVFEGARRFGGKIANGKHAVQSINLGAEFIDSDQQGLVKLAKDLGVKLIPSTDQENERFQLPNGQLLSGDDFHKIYKPLKEMIIQDQKKLAEHPDFEQHINDKSLAEYLHELSQRNKEIDPNVIAIVAGAYASEAGHDPHKVSALQFLGEASHEEGSFLKSDCAWRVEGGTGALIEALKKHLEEKGVKFQTGTKLERLERDSDGKFNLGFTDEKFDKVGLALSAHALAKVEGLEALGMTSQERAVLGSMQYTHSSKIFLKVKEGVDVDHAALFSSGNWQSWNHEKGIVTFLVAGEQLNNMDKDKLMEHLAERYAQAYGKKAADIFERNENGKLMAISTGVDGDRPCYATPAPGQLLAMKNLNKLTERMAEKGVAVAGTYIPHDGSVGFMECGVVSAKKSVDMVDSVLNSIKQQVDALKEGFSNIMDRLTGNNTSSSVDEVSGYANGRASIRIPGGGGMGIG